MQTEMAVNVSQARERLKTLTSSSTSKIAPRKTVKFSSPQASSNANGAKKKADTWKDSLRNYAPFNNRNKKHDFIEPTSVDNVDRPRSGSVDGSGSGIAAEFDSVLSATIVDKKPKEGSFGFSSVIGHEKAKEALRESAILPSLRPELFRGLRRPSRGILLFGPPGNGKTLLVRALAAEMPGSTTLLSLTASTLTSKYVGEGEKITQALFKKAAKKSPSVIFIDEIDSILTARKSNEHEASRRLKTEFFAAFDGLTNDESGKSDVLVIGATNRPHELDDAAIRRFTKRIYVPMPDSEARKGLLEKLLRDHDAPLNENELAAVAKATADYSYSDITNLCRDAAFGPIREIKSADLVRISARDVRKMNLEDFRSAIMKIRISVDKEALKKYREWNSKFGDVSH